MSAQTIFTDAPLVAHTCTTYFCSGVVDGTRMWFQAPKEITPEYVKVRHCPGFMMIGLIRLVCTFTPSRRVMWRGAQPETVVDDTVVVCGAPGMNTRSPIPPWQSLLF